MLKLRQLLSFERVFLTEGLHDDRGLQGVLIDLVGSGVLFAIFLPQMQFQSVALALAILSMVWVKRCLRGRVRLFELLPVSPGFAATAIWAAPALVFILGYLAVYLLSIAISFISPNLFVNTISYLVISSYLSFFGSYADVVFLLMLLFFLTGSVFMQLRGKKAALGFLVFAGIAYFLQRNLIYTANNCTFDIYSYYLNLMFSVKMTLFILSIAALPLSLLLCRSLYKNRNTVKAETTNFQKRLVSFLQAMLASVQGSVVDGAGGLLRLSVYLAVSIVIILVFMPYLERNWIVFIAVPAALITVNLAVNGGSAIPALLPVSKKFSFGSLFAFSTVACVAYYLISINIFNLAVFLWPSFPRIMLPFDIILVNYHCDTQISLMTVFLMATLLIAGAALLMARRRTVRIGGLALMTAAFYGFLSYYDVLLDVTEYTSSTDAKFFLFKIFKHLTIQNELAIYTACAFVVVVPLSLLIGYKLYCGRFPKGVESK